MSTVTSVWSGVSPPHLQSLAGDAPGDDRALGAAGRLHQKPAVKAAPPADDVRPDAPGDAASSDNLLTKLNNLITTEVDSGRLSNERATALRDVFAKAFAGPADGPGPDAASTSDRPSAPPPGRQPPAPPAPTAQKDVGSILNDFLKLLQDAKTSASPYGATGNTANTAPANTSRIMNIRA
jgi:hypothetical protein